MKKTKVTKFINKNLSIIVGVAVFILVLTAAILVKNIFLFDESKAVYGKRLDGIKKVAITKEQKTNLTNNIKDSVEKSSLRISGKIVNIEYTVSAETSLEDAKKVAEKALESFNDDQKKYFDFQFFALNDSNKEQYPIIGYKHRAKDYISWTKDRAGS